MPESLCGQVRGVVRKVFAESRLQNQLIVFRSKVQYHRHSLLRQGDIVFAYSWRIRVLSEQLNLPGLSPESLARLSLRVQQPRAMWDEPRRLTKGRFQFPTLSSNLYLHPPRQTQSQCIYIRYF